MEYYHEFEHKQVFAALTGFPPLNAKKCEEQANSLFKPFLFFRRRKNDIELHCSYCRKSGSMEYLPRTITLAEQMIIDGRHNGEAVCPWCGKGVTLKEIFRLGKKKNLREFIPVVYLTQRRGELFAQCFWTTKDYDRGFTDAPLFMQTAAYRFRPGRAVEITTDYWGERLYQNTVGGNYGKKNYLVEPFSNDCGHPMGMKYWDYTVFNYEALGKSALRYCQYDDFRKQSHTQEPKHSAMMRYLAVYCIYPRPVEMLIKSGERRLVSDLIYKKKKNAAILNWSEPDIKKAFGLNGQELQAWRGSGGRAYRIGEYKRLKKAGLQTSFEAIEKCRRAFGYGWSNILDKCVKTGVKPERVYHYFEKQDGYRTAGEAYTDWEGYIRVAECLRWDLAEHTVRFPRRLKQRHDEAVEEYNLLLAREREEKERKKKERKAELAMGAQKRLKRWRKRYNFSMGGYFIRIAETPGEIRAEGQALKHCVGGYAERHMAGKLTILFLRRCDAPDQPYVTIEMRGEELIQIHGYGNERGGAPSPSDVHKELLDAWLDWIRRGSPRAKDGTPKLAEKKGENAA